MDKEYSVQNTFIGGLNLDTNPSDYNNSQYYNLENFRVIINEGLSNGALVNIKGNVKKITFPTNEVIVGYNSMRFRLIFFTVHSVSGVSSIYSFMDDGTEVEQTLDPTYPVTTNPTTPHFYCIYNDLAAPTPSDKLGFSVATWVRSIGRYETPTIQKVYFADGVHQLRVINIVYSADNNALDTFTQDQFNLVPSIDLSQPEFVSYSSGNLDSGTISYAYQLYRVNGSETVFSPCSKLIPLSSTITVASTDKLYGDYTGLPSGKSINGKIQNVDSSFNRIRIVAIHYSDGNTIPSIRIVDEKVFTTSTVYFLDNGQSLGTYTSAELAEIGQLLLYPKYLETKDNLLFIANVTTEVFWDSYIENWDSRVYRFTSSTNTNYASTCKIYNEAGVQEGSSLVGPNPSYYNMTTQKEFDCINRYNIISNDGNDSYEFMYRKDGITLGGDGPNINITFTSQDYIIRNEGLGGPRSLATSIDANNRDWLTGGKKGWQRDEVYRFGIIFFDKYGRSSFVKWICDLRMPTAMTYDIANYAAGITTSYALYPIFTITGSLPASSIGHQIVACKRTESDKTVFSTGMAIGIDNANPLSLRPLIVLDSLGGVRDKSITWLKDSGLMEFQGPEAVFSSSSPSGDYVDLMGYYSDTSFQRTDRDPGAPTSEYTSCFRDVIPIQRIRVGITEMTKLSTANVVTISGNSFINTPTIAGDGNTKYLIQPSAIFATGDIADTAMVMIRRNIVPYNGNIYASRHNNVYYPCSDYKTSGAISCWYGDTYTGYFEVLRTLYKDSAHYQEVVYLPTESQVVMPMRSDKSLSKGASIANPTGTLPPEIVYTDYVFINEDLWYKYNTVYSRLNNVKAYPTKPFDFSNNDNFDTRVYNSEKKTDGEYSDSWLKYHVANKIEVDSEYGSITNIYNRNNILTFWQPKGFGVLAVNVRAMMQDNNVGQLVLGTGGILERFDYLSTNYGVMQDYHMCSSDNTVYFYDQYNKKIIRYKDDEEELSVNKGINSLINSWTDNDEIILSYSQLYKEVSITNNAYDPTKSKTLIFSENLDSFRGFFSYLPELYIPEHNKLYTTHDLNTVWKHESETIDRCSFYGATADNSVIEIIVTPKQNSICIFDNIELFTKIFGAEYIAKNSTLPFSLSNGRSVAVIANIEATYVDKIYRNISGGSITITSTTNFSDITKFKFIGYNESEYSDILDESIYSIRFLNSYQDSGEIVLVNANRNDSNTLIKRRYRNWRTLVARAINKFTGYRTSERMRDNYLRVQIKYKNNYNKKLLLHNITTFFRMSQL